MSDSWGVSSPDAIVGAAGESARVVSREATRGAGGKDRSGSTSDARGKEGASKGMEWRVDPKESGTGDGAGKGGGRRRDDGETRSETGSDSSRSHRSGRSGGGGSRGGGGRGKGRGKGRDKYYYRKHWDHTVVDRELKRGSLLVGRLRINQRRRNQAYVTVRGVCVDVMVDGDKARNRALNGDIVAVRVAEPDKWMERNAKEEDEEDVDVAAAAAKLAGLKVDDIAAVRHADPTDLYEEGGERRALWAPKIDIRKERGGVGGGEVVGGGDGGGEGASGGGEGERKKKVGGVFYGVNLPKTEAYWKAVEDTDAGTDGRRMQPVGDVVAVLKETHPRDAVGFLRPWSNDPLTQPIRPSSSAYVKLEPMDQRVPWIRIPMEQAPAAFLRRPADMETRLFSAHIEHWDHHERFPVGHIRSSLGESGDIAVETEAILAMNAVNDNPFPEEAVDDLKAFEAAEGEAEWKPPKEVIEARKDFREKRIFTVDPTTARDLDDAVHVERIGENEIEVGVHIADVSFFVRPGTAVDAEASKRCTSTYLVQRVIPMLPRLLSEQLCSLNPNVERLAFSCVWRMHLDGSLVQDADVWYGRSVIRSCCKLDYDTAQRMMDATIPRDACDTGTISEDLWAADRRPTGGHTEAEVHDDLTLLRRVTMQRRQRRYDAGALSLQRRKLHLRLDDEGNPAHVATYPIKDANRMIEELMLLANYLVAQKLILSTGVRAVLRHHEPPLPDRARKVVETARAMGVSWFRWEDAGSLHESLQRVEREGGEDGKVLRMVMENLCMGPMKPAQYFTVSSLPAKEWAHYALAIPAYTHFTSPIRRYADVMVHRLLDAALEGTVGEFYADESELNAQCAECNDRKEAARSASEASDKLFLCVYLRTVTTIDTDAFVVDCNGAKFFEVVIPEIGATKRIYCDGCGGSGEFDSETGILSMYPVRERGTPEAIRAIESLSDDERAHAGEKPQLIRSPLLHRSKKILDAEAEAGGGGGEGGGEEGGLANPYPGRIKLWFGVKVRVRLQAIPDVIPADFEPVVLSTIAWRKAFPPEEAKKAREASTSTGFARPRGGRRPRRGGKS